MMKSPSVILALAFAALLLAGCGGDIGTDTEFAGVPAAGSAFEQPQIVNTLDGGAVLTWTARGDQGVDLFMSRMENDAFAPAVRVNPVEGSVNRLQIDEMRQAVAAGPRGRIAVAWTDTEFDIQASVSDDGGRSFQDPIRLNRDEGEALQEFPSITFDSAGALHAVWLDPRFAAAGLEEPADLYYTVLSETGELQEEVNLTATQESSVCGCCLPHIRALDDGTLDITFRNTTTDGYRDPFRITGMGGQFSAPEPVSRPVWRIDACPVAGPIGVGDATLWLDSSTGTQRLLSAVNPEADPEVVFEESEDRLLLLPPRIVSGTDGSNPVVLVPMADNSRLITPDGDSWRVIADDLPFWVTSAAVHEGRLLLAGTGEGFQFESRRFEELD